MEREIKTKTCTYRCTHWVWGGGKGTVPQARSKERKINWTPFLNWCRETKTWNWAYVRTRECALSTYVRENAPCWPGPVGAPTVICIRPDLEVTHSGMRSLSTRNKKGPPKRHRSNTGCRVTGLWCTRNRELSRSGKYDELRKRKCFPHHRAFYIKTRRKDSKEKHQTTPKRVNTKQDQQGWWNEWRHEKSKSNNPQT